MRLDRAGVWSTPVVLTLGLVLTAGVLSVGLASVDQLQRTRRRQQAVDDFNRFLEQTRLLSMGGEGGTGSLELSLEGEIVIEGGMAELLVGGESLRAELLPIPVIAHRLTAGGYSLELERRADGNLYIEVRRV